MRFQDRPAKIIVWVKNIMNENHVDKADSKPVVVVAGATGFVGQALIRKLRHSCRVIGITRQPIAEQDNTSEQDVAWRQCDFFSLLDAERALEGADYAFYLVHSMMPSARLTQASFQDMDLILADNFARAAAKAGVKQIIYLGGIVPDTKDLSMHLRSRLEVEETLGAHGVPVTALRAGLVVGPRGSTFRILMRLVERFSIIVFSRWLHTQTHPIALSDLIKILEYCLGNPHTYTTFDVGGPDVMSYGEMILRTADVMGLKRRIFIVPFFFNKLSSLLLSIFTSSPMALVTPLMESLKHPMVAGNLRLQERMNLPGLPFDEAVRLALSDEEGGRVSIKPPLARGKIKKALDVRSVQRLPLPKGKSAAWVARHYSEWLPRFFNNIVKVKVDEHGNCNFYFSFLKKSLLEITYSESRSFENRPLYYITGGLMARLDYHRTGRLEFREVLHGKYVLVGIHDYVPTLPWLVYDLTQAMLHIWTMRSYRRHLLSLDEQDSL